MKNTIFDKLKNHLNNGKVTLLYGINANERFCKLFNSFIDYLLENEVNDQILSFDSGDFLELESIEDDGQSKIIILWNCKWDFFLEETIGMFFDETNISIIAVSNRCDFEFIKDNTSIRGRYNPVFFPSLLYEDYYKISKDNDFNSFFERPSYSINKMLTNISENKKHIYHSLFVYLMKNSGRFCSLNKWQKDFGKCSYDSFVLYYKHLLYNCLIYSLDVINVRNFQKLSELKSFYPTDICSFNSKEMGFIDNLYDIKSHSAIVSKLRFDEFEVSRAILNRQMSDGKRVNIDYGLLAIKDRHHYLIYFGDETEEMIDNLKFLSEKIDQIYIVSFSLKGKFYDSNRVIFCGLETLLLEGIKYGV